jgi:stage II sporulation protein D
MVRLWCVPAAVAALVCAAMAGCTAPAGPAALPSLRRAAPAQLRVRVVERGAATVRQVGIEEYVRGAILSEYAPASGEPDVVGRMFEVQAMLSRTYALSHLGRHMRDGYDLCTTTHCQLYEPSRLKTSRWSPAAAEAVRKTAGTVVWFDRAAAATLFHADCGGYTSTPAAVWGGTPHAYLPAHADDGPARDAHLAWRYQAGHDAVRVALNADPRTAVGARLTTISILERDEAGRGVRVRLAGQRTREARGEVVREVLTRAFGARAIRSTRFDVQKQPTTWLFEGRGFGHGVGLCQAGAFARIAAGIAPRDVIQRYFPGTRLVVLR